MSKESYNGGSVGAAQLTRASVDSNNLHKFFNKILVNISKNFERKKFDKKLLFHINNWPLSTK